jgi:energy-converting hydrogenase A subunit M
MSEFSSRLDNIHEEMHLCLAQELLDQIKSGDANAAVLKVAESYLRANAVRDSSESNSYLTELLSQPLPFPASNN